REMTQRASDVTERGNIADRDKDHIYDLSGLFSRVFASINQMHLSEESQLQGESGRLSFSVNMLPARGSESGGQKVVAAANATTSEVQVQDRQEHCGTRTPSYIGLQEHPTGVQTGDNSHNLHFKN